MDYATRQPRYGGVVALTTGDAHAHPYWVDHSLYVENVLCQYFNQTITIRIYYESNLLPYGHQIGEKLAKFTEIDHVDVKM